MTAEELKKLDKQIRKIQYPFGENYPVLRKLFAEMAQQEQISASEVIEQYASWKYNRR